MSRGYPEQVLQRVATRSPSVALSYQRAVYSAVSSLGGGFKVPAPPSGAIAAAAIILTVGYAYRWWMSRPGDAAQPPNVPVNVPGQGLLINQALTFVEQRTCSNWNAAGMTVYGTGFLKDGLSSSYGALTGGFFDPKVVSRVINSAPPPQQHVAPLFVTGVSPNWYFGYTTESRKYPYGNGTHSNWRHQVRIYKNETGAAVSPPIVDAPDVIAPKAIAPQQTIPSRPMLVWSPSFPGTGVQNPPSFDQPDEDLINSPPIYVPIDVVIPERGIGWDAISGVQVATMTPAQEVKMSGSPALVQFIGATIGQFGEAIDVTRCFMFATGNTYTTSKGVEKAIPKWRWREALLGLSGGDKRPIRFHDRKRGYSVNRNGNVFTADGRTLTPGQVAKRLAACFLANELGDAVIAAQSKTLASMGKDLGLTVGGFGAQSILGAAQGSTPYDGLFNFNI